MLVLMLAFCLTASSVSADLEFGHFNSKKGDDLMNSKTISFLITMGVMIGCVLAPMGSSPVRALQLNEPIIVNSLLDPGDGVCDASECTLREALMLANATPGEDRILFNLGIQTPTIILNQALPTITDSVTLDGNLALTGIQGDRVTISGNNQFRIFDVGSQVTVRLRVLTITNGAAHRDLMEMEPERGGGIRSAGTLYIDNTILQDNSADEGGGIDSSGLLVVKNHSMFLRNAANNGADGGHGGAIYNAGKASITNSRVGGLVKGEGNTAVHYGGGLYNAPGSYARIGKATTFAYNVAWRGGAITNTPESELFVDNSFISQNGGIYGAGQQSGGGIWNQKGGKMHVTHVSFSGNSAYYHGGAIYNEGTLALAQTSFQGNAVLDMGGAIFNGGQITIENCTFASHESWNWGGTIHNGSTMFIYNSTFTDSYSWDGGVISNRGTLHISGSTFFENWSDFSGAISNSGTLEVTDSTFRHNDGGYGAAIVNQYQWGHATIDSCTFVENSAYYAGGAIANLYQANLWVTNSTFNGNAARGEFSTVGQGGAIYNESYAAIAYSTISGNTAQVGGGLFNYGSPYLYGTLPLAGTIVAHNTATIEGGDCAGEIISMDYNLDSDGSCSFDGNGDMTGDPLLGPLQHNGGHTETMVLLPGSPAIDHIPTYACAVTVDQRGVLRPQGSACDMGSFEWTP
ncbi:MAG: hypothetical protein IAE79_21690 [Anaerolinea sp.]|nr:hypothetical protein [Anaerolinea sp.]